MSNSPGRREVAHRLFATEYDDASLEYAESDEERAPNYVVSPTGARINRLFAVGVLTSVEQVNEDTVRARIADPTGAFVVYAGQYQPDELAALQSLEPPAFVAITGKANTFQPDGSDRVLTSIRPESVTEVDAETRDRWVVTAAEHTLGRIETVADGLGREERGDELVTALRADGVEPGLAEGVAKAIDHYGTTADYLGALRELSLQAVEVVAGDRSEAESLDVAPGDETGQYAVGDLVDSAPPAATAVTEVAGDVEDVVVDDLGGDEAGADADGESDAAASTDDEAVSEAEPTTTEAEASADSESDEPAETASTSTAATDEEPVEEETADPGSADEGTTDETEVDDATAADSESETTAADEDTTDATESETTESDAATTDADVGGVDDFDADSSVGGDADLDETDDAEGSTDAADEADAESSAGDGEASSDEMYEVDEEERERIEEEYGVGFESGTEVDEPGEAGIDAPTDPEDVEEDEATAAATETDDAAADAGTADSGADADETSGADASADEETADAASGDPESAAESDDQAEENADDGEDEEAAEDVDLESVLLEQMEALDDDDGAERDPLVEAVVEETGADEDAVEDAIEDALMSGQCYEPSDGTYKPI